MRLGDKSKGSYCKIHPKDTKKRWHLTFVVHHAMRTWFLFFLWIRTLRAGLYGQQSMASSSQLSCMHVYMYTFTHVSRYVCIYTQLFKYIFKSRFLPLSHTLLSPCSEARCNSELLEKITETVSAHVLGFSGCSPSCRQL